MALLKEKELENGVTVRYHRIVSINEIINNSIVIEVASYTSEEKRNEDVPSSETKNVFIDTKFYNIDYTSNYSVKKAYEYLKSLDEFKDAEDA